MINAMLSTDSVHAGASGGTPRGLRILASRFRGRFLPKSAYDVWMPNLGPSETLLRRFQSGEITWVEFQREYRREILGLADAGDTRNRTIRNHGQKFTLRLLAHLAQREDVVLLCHCAREEKHCHRHVLAKLIQQSAS